MSTRWDVERALVESDLPAPARLILMMLLRRCDADTAVIPERHSPSLTDLARDTGLDRSTVRRHLDPLEVGGWVVRDRPTTAAARSAGERTQYRLVIPPRGTAPLGAESPVGAENTTPRGSVPPHVGAENTTRRGTAPLKYLTTTKEQPINRGATARHTGAALAVVESSGAQALIGEWIDHCRHRPPGAVVGQVSRQIKALLAEGIPADDVRRGLAAWHGKGLHPATLPSVVHEVMNCPRASPRPSTTDQRVAAGLALAAELEALEGP